MPLQPGEDFDEHFLSVEMVTTIKISNLGMVTTIKISNKGSLGTYSGP